MSSSVMHQVLFVSLHVVWRNRLKAVRHRGSPSLGVEQLQEGAIWIVRPNSIPSPGRFHTGSFERRHGLVHIEIVDLKGDMFPCARLCVE